MINDEPSVKEMAKLSQTCIDFINEQTINCPETIYQTDWVIENAFDLIEVICVIVGYQNDE